MRFRVQGLGVSGFRVLEFQVGMLPLMLAVLVGIVIGGTVIPIKDCLHKGEHPSL